MKKFLIYGAGLIALYLLVEHATGAGTLLNSGTNFAVSTTKALQGR